MVFRLFILIAAACLLAVPQVPNGSVAAEGRVKPVNYWHPTWSPSGRIAFTTDRDGNKEVYCVNADGTGREKLIKPNTF